MPRSGHPGPPRSRAALGRPACARPACLTGPRGSTGRFRARSSLLDSGRRGGEPPSPAAGGRDVRPAVPLAAHRRPACPRLAAHSRSTLFRMARMGLLTGGGDCPGLNAVIRAAVRSGQRAAHSFVGFRYGWAGVLADEAFELTPERTVGILPRGGTILGTSRTNPFADGRDGTDEIRATLRRREIDALIPIG